MIAAEGSPRLGPLLGLGGMGLELEMGALLGCVVGGDLLAAKLLGWVMMVMGPIS